MDLRRYILPGLSEDRDELIRKNRRLIILRWIYLGILGAIAVGIPYIVQAPTVTVVQHAAIFSTALVLNTFLFFANSAKTKPLGYYQVISFLQIMIDLGVATAGVAIQGGVNSRAIILYVLPILAAGLLFMSKPLVYSAALLSSIAYIAIIVFVTIHSEVGDILPRVGGPVLFYPVLFFIIARLVVYLNEHNIKDAQSETQEEMFAMLTHQLKHPGSVIGAIIDTMEGSSELKNSTDLKRYVDMIKTENARSTHLIDNVLQAANPLDFTREEDIELVSLIKKVARRSALVHKRAQDIQFHTPEEVNIQANNEKLRMVFENVLNNAVRFSQDGTPIEVEIEADTTEVKVSVTDHGQGMDKQQLKTVRDKFGHTTAPEGQPYGAGLGMYLVKELLEHDGGRVDIDSLPDKGTEVTMIIKRSGK